MLELYSRRERHSYPKGIFVGLRKLGPLNLNLDRDLEAVLVT